MELTIKEAIEQLTDLQNHCEDMERGYLEGEDNPWEKDAAAIGMAIRALEKIPHEEWTEAPEVKVYGYSDDLVEIEGSRHDADEIGCYGSFVRIWFTDGTIIKVDYEKNGFAIWGIEVETQGTAEQRLEECWDEDADPYSDVFYIKAEVLAHEVIDK